MSTVMNNLSKQVTFQPVFRKPLFYGAAVPVTQSADVRLGLILGCAQHKDIRRNNIFYNLCILDLDAQGCPMSTIPMQFFGHGIVPDPANSELVSVFEKRGRGACEIDLKQGIVTRTIETRPNRQFYGHGAYSRDGQLLYCTETITEGDYEGVIAVRDAGTHEYLGDFPSYGSSPHDCRLVNDGATLVVTNGGGKLNGAAPNVSYIDVRSQTLIERLEFDSEHVNAGHLDITSDGKLAVVSAQREGLPEKALGGISFRRDGVLRTIKEPTKLVEHLFDESLSVCIHEPGNIVGATTPAGNLVTFWNIESGELLHYYILQNPRGIELTRDGNYFVVSYGQGDPPEALCLISSATLEHTGGYDLVSTGITGSHLTSYSLPPALRQ